MNKSQKITIAGGGLVGALQAVFMDREGFQVDVYEKRPDPTKNKIEAGRSINLALSNRGWKALEAVGLKQQVQNIAIPMYRRTIHNQNGTTTYQPYGKKGEAIFSVSRSALNQLLIEEATKNKSCNFYFNAQIDNVNSDRQTIAYTNNKSKRPKQIPYEVLFGADGAFSAIRNSFFHSTRFNYSQDFIAHGYKELHIPPDKNGKHQLETNTLHIWPRGNFMLIALPNLDGSFTCTLFFPYFGNPSFDALKTDAQISNFFNKFFPKAQALMPGLLDQYHANPTSDLVTVRCAPWHINNNILLLGDAAHAIVPFYGQGMNAGFEDCTLFNQFLKSNNGNILNAIQKFSIARKEDTDAIADLALKNFIEMRDHTAKKEFLLRKKIEKALSEAYPKEWLPQYSMVTFSQLPYSKALKEGRLQDEVMQKIMQMPDIEKKWNRPDIQSAILEQLKQLKNGQKHE